MRSICQSCKNECDAKRYRRCDESTNQKADIRIETLKAHFVRSAVLGVACSKGPQILNLPFVIVAANGS